MKLLFGLLFGTAAGVMKLTGYPMFLLYIVGVMFGTNLYYTKVLNHVENSDTAPELYMEHFPESFGSFMVPVSSKHPVADVGPRLHLRVMTLSPSPYL